MEVNTASRVCVSASETILSRMFAAASRQMPCSQPHTPNLPAHWKTPCISLPPPPRFEFQVILAATARRTSSLRLRRFSGPYANDGRSMDGMESREQSFAFQSVNMFGFNLRPSRYLDSGKTGLSHHASPFLHNQMNAVYSLYTFVDPVSTESSLTIGIDNRALLRNFVKENKFCHFVKQHRHQINTIGKRAVPF